MCPDVPGAIALETQDLGSVACPNSRSGLVKGGGSGDASSEETD